MSFGSRKKIIRLLGVGFDNDDGHIRISRGKQFDVLMGSEESHTYLTELITKIEAELKRRSIDMDKLSPDELGQIIQSIK